MKLNALLVDPALLGDEGWDYLERVAAMLPDLGLVVCTGRSTVAQRVRGLRLGVDDWITKPCHPEEAIARIEAVTRRRRRAAASSRRPRSSPASSRSAPTASRPSSATAASTSPAASSSCCTCWPRRAARCSSARRSTSGSGATRWPTAIARSTSSSASCARSSRSTRRAGPTSTPTSAIGYRFDPEPAAIVEDGAAPCSRGAPTPDRPSRASQSRSQRPSRRGNRRSRLPRHARRAWRREPGTPRSSPPGGWRSGPRSTPRWSTAGR